MTKARENADNVTGDISAVTAGTGLTGGGTSGTVTLTNDMATTIAAKGDLLAGTANDAYAALTAGTNEQRLVADSAQAAGLKYVADTTNYAIAAKGDILAGTAADTLAALTVGANGTVLTAASGEATGLQWATPSGASTANFTLLNSGATSLPAAASYTLSGLGGNYSQFAIFFDSVSMNAANSYLGVRLNGSSASNYASHGFYISYKSSYASTGIFNKYDDPSADRFLIAKMSANAASSIAGGIQIFGGKTTGTKVITAQGGATTSTGVEPEFYSYHGYNSALAATITSITILSDNGNFDSGNVYIYGTA